MEKIKRLNGIPEIYIEPAEGTDEWYVGVNDNGCDLYEVEEIFKEEHYFQGTECYLIHYPDGEVYKPFNTQANVYVNKPIWDNGKFGILVVDFNLKKIFIYHYLPESNKLKEIAEIPLSTVKDCYNLILDSSPLILGRSENNGIYEIVWPVKKEIQIEDTETLLYRDEDVLYFSQWVEDPEYHEYIIKRDMKTGKVLEKVSGMLYKMPNGTIWKV
ncbi:hypothetical protein [Hathewaya limosa]|uniref:KWG repeat-containing protein n=1 Tax=Hathewaya limosa TaxID=1536 RepID=A0ABU0JVR9_HATLI|nr:hypothetical protein [Hathewaya limosa]MDQ0480535.1 hypothetical protein [Hathewaya limosa]